MIALNILETVLWEGARPGRKRGSWLLFVGNLKSKIKENLVYLALSLSALYLVMISAGAIGRTATYQEWSRLLAPQNETFTALYFENPAALPEKVAAGERIDFAFTIENSEGTNQEYAYIVYFSSGSSGKRIAVDKGKVGIPSGGKKTITETYTFKQNHEKEILVVELIDRQQEIHFILTQPKPSL